VDKEMYAERVELIKSQLYRTALLYFGSEAMAMDAVAESVYRGLISVKKLREPEYFDTWMTRILINECHKIYRRTKREQSLDSVPEATSEQDFDSLALQEAIRHLPPELREVILLRYYSDFTLAQTAKSLDIPQGTVVTRQRRALALLKLELLEEEAQ
jgi:RNA polymerase sigma-70 factor (ECF subfamily)